MIKITKEYASRHVAAVAKRQYDVKGYLSPVQKVVVAQMALALLEEIGLVKVEDDQEPEKG